MPISQYYVDPAAGNDTTGNGSSATPWKTVQKALNTITRNTTDGDQINVKAGAADVLSAALSLTTYGTPTSTAPVTIRGYTTTANDGGIGELTSDGNSYGIYTGLSYVSFVDMKIGNCGGATIYDGIGWLIRCEVYGSSAQSGVFIRSNATVEYGAIGCYFHTLTGQWAVRIGIGNVSGGIVRSCFLDLATTQYGLYMSGYGGLVDGNIIRIGGADTSVDGIYVDRPNVLVQNNVVYCANANTGSGIKCDHHLISVVNNIVQGWSGAGGVGINVPGKYGVVGGNVVYNCTTAESLQETNFVLAATTTAGSTPFENAAGGDFRPAAGGAAIEAAWPQVFPALAAVANKADVGAYQRGAGSGGGGLLYPVVGNSIVRGAS